MGAQGNFLFDDVNYDIVRWQQGGQMLDGCGQPAIGLNDSFMTDNLSITTATTSDTVLLTGSGNDWINLQWSAYGATIDPGSGFNFINGSTTAVMGIDSEASSAQTINTIANFHAGDLLSLNGNFTTTYWGTAANGDATLTALSANAAPIVNDFQGQSAGQFMTLNSGHGVNVIMPT